MTDEFATWDAAYVLGALPPEERAAYEEHLGSCLSCAGAVRELAGLPGLLSRVPPDSLDDEPEEVPPPSLLPRLLAVTERERARRRWRWTAAVAAVAACLVAVAVLAVVALVPSGTPSGAPSGRPVAMAPVGGAAVPMHVSVQLADQSWGTEVHLTCRYDKAATYLPSQYSLVAVARTGQVRTVAEWGTVPGSVSKVTGSTAWRRDQIQRLEVRTPTGQPVLRLRV